MGICLFGKGTADGFILELLLICRFLLLRKMMSFDERTKFSGNASMTLKKVKLCAGDQKTEVLVCVVYPFFASYPLDFYVPVHHLSCLSPPRSLILNTIPESVDAEAIDFITNRLKASEITPLETSELVVITFNHVSANEKVMMKAKVCNR